jgi:hypothetical protein
MVDLQLMRDITHSVQSTLAISDLVMQICTVNYLHNNLNFSNKKNFTMNSARNISLLIATVLWATLIGGIVYSHVVFLPAYLPNLPESTSLVKGPYALVDERFWMMIHPLLIITVTIALILNWKVVDRRNLMLSALGIYLIVLVITFIYFVPELLAFAKSAESGIEKREWVIRGTMWEQLSWIRGAFMFGGFVLLQIALTKNNVNTITIRARKTKNKVLEGMIN